MRTSTTLSTILLAASLATAAPAVVQRSNNTADASDVALPNNVKANPRGSNKALLDSLMLAPTQRDRVKLLNQPGDWKFDFKQPRAESESNGLGGHTVAADSSRFPALLGNGAAMTIGFLGPCGFNTPHTHPRGTELNLVIEGALVTEFIMENGVPPIQNYVDTYQMTVFPMGATHAEYNPTCGNATFVAGFSSEDPGVQQSAQTFFGLRTDMVKASLGVDSLSGADLETYRKYIPANVAIGVDSCLKKCGLSRNPKREIDLL
jgi:hypothetical protein